MGKHNQNAALGKISDFASSPPDPTPPEERLERLERIETRLENIEKLLNTVLYAVTDLNESFDKVSKSPAKTTPTQKPKRQQAQKPTQKPTPNKQPSRGKGISPEQEALKQEALKQEALARACEPQVLDFLADGKTVSYKEVFQEMRDREFSKKLMKRVLNHLSDSGKIKNTKQEIEGETVSYVSLAKR